MKAIVLITAILFSLSTPVLYSQTAKHKGKEFPEEIHAKWYYQFIEKLDLTPQDFSEFGYFFINGKLVSENESGKVYINGIAVFNTSRVALSNFGEFEVYYFSVFEAKTDYELYFERVEFWEVDQDGKMNISNTLNSKEGYYYKQHYYSDTDVLFTGESYITSEYEELLKTYNIE